MRTLLRIWSFALLALCCAACVTTREQPGIGLALGGGGAKGAAEVGALMTLDKAGVRVGYVSGTSMGAVVGGLYAAGYTGEEIKELWLNEDWLTLFDKSTIGSFHDGGDGVERNIFGVVDGEGFEACLREALKRKGVSDFEDLKHIQFRCTATQLADDNSLHEVVLSSGDMAKAIHASMAYPAPLVGISSVEIDGKTLVDGGMLNNLPVDVVRDMGAKNVIAVDLEMKQKHKRPFWEKAGLNFLLGVNSKIEALLKVTKTEWLIRWELEQPDVERHKNNWASADVRVWPLLTGYDILCFDRKDVEKMILIGKQAMQDQLWKVADLLDKRQQTDP